jgi:hypothetical protein
MKKILLSISLTLIAATSFGQWTWNIDFEDTTTLHRVLIDTVANPNNIWQIGHPNKTLFTSANSNPNAIVTDTVNPYPINDTSSFTIIHIAELGWSLGYPKVDIGGYYSVNSDTLTDFGYIDFSPDLGNTWYRADSASGNCSWGAIEDLPTFTGNSNGWKHFYYCLQVPFPVAYGDTILYRFTFISDSVQTNKDGLMFDDLHFEDWAEGIQEVQNDNLISISPNPTSDKLKIHINKVTDNIRVQVLNYTGQILLDENHFKEQAIDTRQFNNGIYLLKYSDTKNFAIKTFVVQH